MSKRALEPEPVNAIVKQRANMAGLEGHGSFQHPAYVRVISPRLQTAAFRFARR